MKFILPQGIGDSIWAMHKVQSVSKELGDGKIEIYLNCQVPSGVEARALDFVKRFSFVNNAEMLQGFNIHPQDKWVDEQGRYIYIPDGPTRYGDGQYYALMPNGHLERGNRLETWLPQFDIDWSLMRQFRIYDGEIETGAKVKKMLGDYAVFYLGPLAGNLGCGHNREGLWKPQDWVDLGKRLHDNLGLSIVVVGADYDYSYYSFMVEPLLGDEGRYWTNFIGDTNVGELYSVTTNSRMVISYQSGVGIVSSYLGVPTAIFWRPKGNSINSEIYISFEEEMASAWTRPDMLSSGKHLPLIYGRHHVSYIADMIKHKGW